MSWWWATTDDVAALRADIAALGSQVKNLEGGILSLSQQGAKLMSVVDDIAAEVADEITVVGSVGTLIDQLVAKINDLNIPDPRLSSLLSQMQANKQVLVQKTIENTPAAPGA